MAARPASTVVDRTLKYHRAASSCVPIRAVVAVLLLSIAGWPPVGPPPDLSAAYPNPVLPQDDGEFVVIDVPDGTDLEAYELADGEDVVRLPAVNVTGEVALAVNTTPAELASFRVVRVDSLLSLSNAGERIELRRASDGRVVDSLTYEDAREAELQTDAGPVPLGATAHQPTTVRDADVTTFVLPDDPRPIHAELASADDRLYLAGYTLTSARVRASLVDAASRGVDVRVLLDGSPVGGDSPAQVDTLDALAAAGIDVRMVGGPRARYAFHHAKYAVVDDTALVLTENWKASGTGGHSNRGWGILVDDSRFASELAAIFESDRRWLGTKNWTAVREPASRDAHPAANDTYPVRFPARESRAESVTLAVTPDNAEAVVREFVRTANETLRVQQVRLDDWRLERDLIAAAQRGVDVEVLLSGRWYVRDENQRLARCLTGYAERAGLPLTVRVVEPRSRFGKVHAKVAVADGERVLLGSLNWNRNALERNREVIVVSEGPDVASYYERVFRADWRGGAWRLPWSLLATTVLAMLGAGWWLHRTVAFDGGSAAAGLDDSNRVWVDEPEEDAGRTGG